MKKVFPSSQFKKDYKRYRNKPNKYSIQGQLIAVDDQWHGLNITQDVTITIN